MTKITDEMVGRFVRLHRLGQSYRAIGKQFGVDPRTVQSRVQRATQQREAEHWEAVLRQVDVHYLHEHYRLLVQLAVRLLEVAHTEPMFSSQADAHRLFEAMIDMGLEGAEELLAARGVDLESQPTTSVPDSLGLPPKGRLARKLYESLLEHEPDIKAFLGTWNERWAEFQQLRARLAEEAESLFSQQKVADEVGSTLAHEVADGALLSALVGQRPISLSTIERGDGLASLVLDKGAVTHEVYEGPSQRAQEASRAFELVCQQVSHEARLDPLVAARRSLVECVRGLEDRVDRIVLRGKPAGQCSLCPGVGDIAPL